MPTTAVPVPAEVKPYFGSILDADSHEYTPVNLWEEQFGPVVRDFVTAFEHSKMPIRRFVPADVTEISADTVWETKFARAPGAWDINRRLEVLDFTGVRRQLSNALRAEATARSTCSGVAWETDPTASPVSGLVTVISSPPSATHSPSMNAPRYVVT